MSKARVLQPLRLNALSRSGSKSAFRPTGIRGFDRVEPRQMMIDPSEDSCFVLRIRHPFDHTAPVEFPVTFHVEFALTFHHSVLVRAGQQSRLTLGRPVRAYSRTPLSIKDRKART